MKYLSDSGLPYGVHHKVHSHNGLRGAESIPHVHISGKGCDVSISIQGAYVLAGSFGGVSEKDIINWVQSHYSDLMDEWNYADDPWGGRN